MPPDLRLLTLLCLSAGPGAPLSGSVAGSTPWPEATAESHPWTRWWWPGSAVDPAGITRQLEAFARAGLGGVEITPICGARGFEDRAIPYLSKRWMEMLEHTAHEAHRLGMKVDMATGTGWPFGGPWVGPADGAQEIVRKNGRLSGQPTGMRVKRAAPGAEGLVVDPYSVESLGRYLAPFTWGVWGQSN